VHRAEVQHVGDGLEVQQRGLGAVGVDVRLVHLEHVRGIAACELGGELVPVAGPLAVLGGDLDVVVRVGEQLERLTREAVAQVAAPPVDAQRSAALPAAGGVGAAARQGRERRDGTGGGEQGQ